MERIPDPAGVVLENVWNAEWQKNLLDTALERIKIRINPKQYQIFHLLVVKNLPPEQVADCLEDGRVDLDRAVCFGEDPGDRVLHALEVTRLGELAVRPLDVAHSYQ